MVYLNLLLIGPAFYCLVESIRDRRPVLSIIWSVLFALNVVVVAVAMHKGG